MVNHMRHNRGQTGSRRSHHALASASFTLCEKCGNPREKHVMCPKCGTYKGKVVVDILAKANKKAAKIKTAEGR